jgi:hypothetical protein
MTTAATLSSQTARSGAVQLVPLRRAQFRASRPCRVGRLFKDGKILPSSSCVAKSALLLHSPADQFSMIQSVKLYMTLFSVGFAAFLLAQQEQV